MTVVDILLATMAFGVGCVLAWRSGVIARVVLFTSAMLVSAMLFLPGDQLGALAGRDTIRTLEGFVSKTPWPLSDWMHFAIFVWLGVLLWLGRPDLRDWKGWGLIAFLGVTAEVAQGLAPQRQPRLDDVLLNLAGGMGGLVVGIVLANGVRFVRRMRASWIQDGTDRPR